MSAPNPSGLSSAHRIRARDLAIQAALLGLHNAPAIHYTQGAKRWQGIDNHLKSWRGEYPKYADCSAFTTWCLWNGLDHFHVRDVVNGAAWKAGYTGTQLDHGERIDGRFKPQRADLVLYGTGYPGHHVAIVIVGHHAPAAEVAMLDDAAEAEARAGSHRNTALSSLLDVISGLVIGFALGAAFGAFVMSWKT